MQKPSSPPPPWSAAGQFLDAPWYAKSYPDVALSGLDAHSHYLRYGLPVLGRPPAAHLCGKPGLQAALMEPPAPRGAELMHADEMCAQGRHASALTFAELHLPPEYRYTLDVLRANAACARADHQGWLAALNRYLAHFGTAPVCLRPGEAPPADRLSTAPLAPVTGGPLVSVLMPAWNREDTIEMAVGSILSQTWRNLELIVVDDHSSDGTWAVLRALAARDSRLKIRKSGLNTGPYVAKNIALDMAEGAWITCHDADDWAHPSRIAQHMAAALGGAQPLRASLTHMLRMRAGGQIDTITPRSAYSFDGAARVCALSVLFEARTLRRDLGYWDSMRYGADSEMIARCKNLLGEGFQELRQLTMLCLSRDDNLTNDPLHGIRANAGASSRNRQSYKKAWEAAHRAAPQKTYLPFPQEHRIYSGDFTHAVSWQDQTQAQSGAQSPEPL